jgi:calcineurin-like phosphoesterase family protein
LRTFITADLHLGHANIIKYANRPFKNVDHMDAEIIRRWNERVKPEDTVIHNGDFCFYARNEKRGEGSVVKFKDWRGLLNGNIIFIGGNHDKRSNGIVSHISSMVLYFGKKEIWVTHKPQNMNTAYQINFTAHSHDAWDHRFVYDGEKKIILINVGTDQWNFYPQTVQEILDKYRKFI